jgi:hypothetical protein
MKAYLSFNLNNNEERIKHAQALIATNLALALCDIRERLRQTHKHGSEPMAYEEFFNILSSYNINLYDIME